MVLNDWKYLVLGAVGGVSIGYLYFKSSLERERELRRQERQGRIAKERGMRVQFTKKAMDEKGFTYMPIATLRSPFSDRRGTPRQPLLVPAAKARIEFDVRRIQPAHFKELEEFSHVWLVWVFHDNTNEGTKNARVSMAKVAPPRLKGKKVGVLSTRSPHRPNNIGLSVCEVVNIGDTYIEVAACDMVDGTPILDIKPYIPYDIIETSQPLSSLLPMVSNSNGKRLPLTKLRVPEWITEPDIKMKQVEFSEDVMNALKSLVPEKGHKGLMELVKQCLRQDIRCTRKRGTQDATEDYQFKLNGLDFRFRVTEINIEVISMTKTDNIDHSLFFNS